MATKKDAAPVAKDSVIASAANADLVLRQKEAADRPVQKAGEKGPPSSLETGVGSPTGASAGGDHDYEGRRKTPVSKGQLYSVQVHSDEAVGGLKRGVQVIDVMAESGDEAALKVREGHKANYGLSIRGITPASDPDANSLGGERDASIMINNAENPGDGANVWPGTEANRKAVEGLGKADIEDLGE